MTQTETLPRNWWARWEAMRTNRVKTHLAEKCECVLTESGNVYIPCTVHGG